MKERGLQGTDIKVTWTKSWGVGSRVGGGDRCGVRGVVRGECRQLYLNNNKKENFWKLKKINVCK